MQRHVLPQNFRVGDASVQQLSSALPHLRSLNLAHCGVTSDGIQRLSVNSARTQHRANLNCKSIFVPRCTLCMFC